MKRTSNHLLLSLIEKVLIPCGAVAIFSFLSICLCIFIRRKRNVESLVPSRTGNILRLSYADLLKATAGFSRENFIGARRFGSVYKGILNEGQLPVAVKVINLDIKGASRSFVSECNALRGIRHRNLVKLMSVCSSIDFQGNEFKALIYEFKENGNLDEWLHQNLGESSHHSGGSRRLSMRHRLSIAVDIASALEYLHYGTNSAIVHCDLKPSNIFLDENMTAHVGDFGLAKVFSNMVSITESSPIGINATIAYIPPGTSRMVSVEGDVYTFGILLLEMFTGRRPTDDSFEDNSILHDFVKDTFPNQLEKVLDQVILDEQNYEMNTKFKNCMKSVIGLALACSVEVPRDRLQMSDVVNTLCKIINAGE